LKKFVLISIILLTIVGCADDKEQLPPKSALMINLNTDNGDTFKVNEDIILTYQFTNLMDSSNTLVFSDGYYVIEVSNEDGSIVDIGE
jgi:hypothetical protein